MKAEDLIARLKDAPEEALVVALAEAIYGIEHEDVDRVIDAIEASGDVLTRLRALGYDIVAARAGDTSPP